MRDHDAVQLMQVCNCKWLDRSLAPPPPQKKKNFTVASNKKLEPEVSRQL
jgi:hypothetical protein